MNVFFWFNLLYCSIDFQFFPVPHNMRIRYNRLQFCVYLCRPETTIIFTQTILHCDRIFFSLLLIQITIYSICIFATPFPLSLFSCIRRQNLISKAFKNIFVLFSKQTKLIFLSIECQILTLNLIFDKFICIHHVLWFMKSK